jgi:non-ribosomal peptide synthetase component F
MAGQLGIWYAQQLRIDDPAFNIGQYLEIHDLDLGLFEAALRHCLNNAEAAHLRFIGEDEAPRQYVDKSGDWPFLVVDMSSAPGPSVAAHARMWADMMCPVDLRRGPLFTNVVFKVAPRRYFWYQRVHHIAADGFSAWVFASGVAQAYTSLLAGRPMSETVAEPFSALIEAERSYRASADYGRDREFWLAALSDFPVVSGLGGGRRPKMPRMPVRHAQEIRREAAADLRAAARKRKTTVAQLLIGAVAVYFHHATGTEDIVLGLPVPGRLGIRRGMIPGMTTNILPIRLTIKTETSVADLVRQVNGAVRDAMRHQRYRYEDIRRDLNLADDRALFGLVVNIMSFDHSLNFGDRVPRVYNLSNGPIDDVRIAVHDGSANGTMLLSVDVNPDLYGPETARQISERFSRILNWVVSAAPDDRAWRAEMLAEAERRQLLSGWNDTAREVPAATLPALFEAQAALVPDAVAVVCAGTALTYAGLNSRANRLARLLAGRGVGPESVVAVALDRSADLVVALLAVVKAGAAYLPVDPAYPAERIAFMLRDSRPPVLLVTVAIASAIPGSATTTTLVVDEPGTVTALRGASDSDLTDADRVAALRQAHPVYLMYTSGSSGRPKGVVVSHRGLVSLVAAQRAVFGVGRGAVVLGFAPFSFDASVWELVMALAAGATLAVASAAERAEPGRLAVMVARAGVGVARAGRPGRGGHADLGRGAARASAGRSVGAGPAFVQCVRSDRGDGVRERRAGWFSGRRGGAGRGPGGGCAGVCAGPVAAAGAGRGGG